MEYWDDVIYKKIYSLLAFWSSEFCPFARLSFPKGTPFNATDHYPNFPGPIIPTLQYYVTPVVSEAN